MKAHVEKLNAEKKHLEEQLHASETASAELKQQCSESEAQVSSLRAQLSEVESEVSCLVVVSDNSQRVIL